MAGLSARASSFVDENIGVVIGTIVIGDVDIVPGQPQDLTHPQGAGKGQVHRYIELAVRTLIQGGADHIGGPDVPLLYSVLGSTTLSKGFLAISSHRTACLKAQRGELDDLLDGGVSDQVCLCVMDMVFTCRGF